MKLNELIRYNLQFFADEGEEDPVPAEPDVDETENQDGTDDADAGEDSDEDSNEGEGDEDTDEPEEENENGKYAAARRKAEEQYRSQLAVRDAEFVKRFGDLENPITHEKIKSEKDYFSAIDAANQLKMQDQLKEAGVDADLLQKAIESNPIVQQANAVLSTVKQQEAQRQMESDLKNIQKIDPSIKSLNDVFATENAKVMMEYVEKHGLKLDDAYKLANIDKLSELKTKAAKQAAINKARGKNHMTPTGANSIDDSGLADIPNEEISTWKKVYPNLSMSELKKKYNNSLY